MQFGVTAGQIEAVGIRQLAIMDRREEAQLRAHRPQQIEAGTVGEGKGFVTSDGNAHAVEQRLSRDHFRRGELHGRWQRYLATAGQRLGGRVETQVQIIQFAGLHQTEMAARQLDPGFPRQRAVPTQTFGEAAFEQLRMTQSADAVGQHPGKRQVRLIARQPQRQCTKGLGHGGAIDHTKHRHAEMPRQISTGRRAVEQAHHAFDQDQIGFGGGFPQQAAAFLLADHPHVHLIHRRTAGALENHRVEEVRAALEHAHLAPLIAMQTSERGSNGGLALTGGRRGNQYRRAVTWLIQSSTPFCALMPA